MTKYNWGEFARWLLWPALVALTIAVAEWVLFRNAACLTFLNSLIVLTPGLTILAVALLAYRVVSGGSGIDRKPFMGSIVFVVVMAVIIPTVLGPVLSNTQIVRHLFCPDDCQNTIEKVDILLANEEFNASLDLLKDCTNSESNQECRDLCGCRLARALYGRAGKSLDQHECSTALQDLQSAENAGNSSQGCSGLLNAITERRKRIYEDIVCFPPTPTATPSNTPTERPSSTPTNTNIPTSAPTATDTPLPISIEILRADVERDIATIDFRVFQGGSFLSNLTQGDATLILPNGLQPVPTGVTFSRRDADDPICMIAVVDISESIPVPEGRDQIKRAIQGLNTLRKPNDELGLVLFGDTASSAVLPSNQSIDPEVIKITGNTTALWDGMLEGIGLSGRCSSSVRYLLVLTDGRDNSSIGTNEVPLTPAPYEDNFSKARKVAEHARKFNVSICSIGVLGQSGQRSNVLEEGPLREASTGCEYTPATSYDKLTTLFQTKFGYVRNFYRLQFAASALSPQQPQAVLRVLNTREATIDFSR